MKHSLIVCKIHIQIAKYLIDLFSQYFERIRDESIFEQSSLEQATNFKTKAKVSEAMHGRKRKH